MYVRHTKLTIADMHARNEVNHTADMASLANSNAGVEPYERGVVHGYIFAALPRCRAAAR